jgi:uncharacterized protein (DUF427 family)
MIKRIPPGPGQESVWDYPRPPRLEDFPGEIKVVFGGFTIARSLSSKRVMETSHPPVYYIPPEDIVMEYLELNNYASWCEWKGKACYYNIVMGDTKAERAAWFYPNPVAAFKDMTDYVAFYAELMEGCFVNGEKVKPQPGNFYGGWITSNIVGPFKGIPGSWHW